MSQQANVEQGPVLHIFLLKESFESKVSFQILQETGG